MKEAYKNYLTLVCKYAIANNFNNKQRVTTDRSLFAMLLQFDKNSSREELHNFVVDFISNYKKGADANKNRDFIQAYAVKCNNKGNYAMNCIAVNINDFKHINPEICEFFNKDEIKGIFGYASQSALNRNDLVLQTKETAIFVKNVLSN